MKSYLTKDIRNVGIVGHGGTGKTQLVSSLPQPAGMTALGKSCGRQHQQRTGTKKKSRENFHSNRPLLCRVAPPTDYPSGFPKESNQFDRSPVIPPLSPKRKHR